MSQDERRAPFAAVPPAGSIKRYCFCLTARHRLKYRMWETTLENQSGCGGRPLIVIVVFD